VYVPGAEIVSSSLIACVLMRCFEKHLPRLEQEQSGARAHPQQSRSLGYESTTNEVGEIPSAFLGERQ